jgi:prophage maintenance system killer protein
MSNELTAVSGDQAVYIVPGDEGTRIDVRIASETVWLTQLQIADLFGVSVPTINEHFGNIYGEGELERGATIRNFRIVRQEGGRTVRRGIDHYSLDAVISVGYRVNSKTATAFRQWATQVLKAHLLDEHKKRNAQAARYPAGLKNVELLAHHTDADASEVLDLIGRYARSWRLLLQYDENRLPPPPSQPTKRMQRLTLIQATKAIDRFRKTLVQSGQATDFFGKVRSEAFAGILGNLEQTFGGAPLYPNVLTRAAHLLYFIIKDHPFVDGNKRIGSLLFLEYLRKNGRKLIDESALVALALLIAESDPKHKDMLVRLVISLLQDDGEARTP